MPCYDPPYDMPQMQASAVEPYVETLREIDQYCAEELEQLKRASTSFPPLESFVVTIQDMVHRRFRTEKLHTSAPKPASEEPYEIDRSEELHVSHEALTPADVLRREVASHQTQILWHQSQIEEYQAAIKKVERTH